MFQLYHQLTIHNVPSRNGPKYYFSFTCLQNFLNHQIFDCIFLKITVQQCDAFGIIATILKQQLLRSQLFISFKRVVSAKFQELIKNRNLNHKNPSLKRKYTKPSNF